MNICLENIKEKINFQKLKYVFIWTFIFGLIVHGYCYFNSNFSHDSLTFLFKGDANYYISIGRFIRPVYQMIFGGNAVPLLRGVLFLFYLSFSIFFIMDVLEINNKVLVLISIAVLISNRSMVCLNATFLHDIDSYSCSMFFCLLGVWLSIKTKKGIYLTVDPKLDTVKKGLFERSDEKSLLFYAYSFRVIELNPVFH